ncbi:MAG: antitoxin family protein [Planctomycetes bacterium]|nr:antitoxin family protein [Planctomycetota bacterium]
MSITVQAVYTGGVLRPMKPLAINDGAIVEITIVPAESVSLADDELSRRIQACKTYQEWLEITRSLPCDDEGYDIVKALDENRRWSGEQPLLPDEGRQP